MGLSMLTSNMLLEGICIGSKRLQLILTESGSVDETKDFFFPRNPKDEEGYKEAKISSLFFLKSIGAELKKKEKKSLFKDEFLKCV